jgi:hypothetical protein
MNPLFEHFLPRWIKDHNNWLSCLQYAMRKGLVFRLREGPDKVEKWKPGVIRKDGSYWVWTEKSIEELREYDIHLPQVRRSSFSMSGLGLSNHLRLFLMTID